MSKPMAPRILVMVGCSFTKAMSRKEPWQRVHTTSMLKVLRSSSCQEMYLACAQA